ncbi:MAG TPA: 4Fe-4S dicluster domain-containing protein [Dongiaceae bacterium]
MPPVTTGRVGGAIELRRREALKLLAAGMATALAGCGKPNEEIIPYVEMPERMAAGDPLRFATTLALSGYGRGVLAISVDGRPIKLEGNPRHPYSMGATDIFCEATVQSLYDPDRSQVARRAGVPASWDSFLAEWNEVAGQARTSAGLGLVTGRVVSPTTLRLISELQKRFSSLRWYRYEPVNDDQARTGARLAFGRAVAVIPRLRDADVVVSLWADPLGAGPPQLRQANDFAHRRGGPRPQRHYVAEPAWTLTGAAADWRLPARPENIRRIASAIGGHLGSGQPTMAMPPEETAFAAKAAADLTASRGRALVLAGEGMPAEVQALCHWLNASLGAPVDIIADPDPVADSHADSLETLVRDMRDGRLSTLIIADANPVYDAPDDFDITQAFAAIPFSVHFGSYLDETAAACHWHLPQSHVLESWGDSRAVDGTASLIQPLIRRLYDSRTCDEFFALLEGVPAPNGRELVRETWQAKAHGDFEAWWRDSLERGIIPGSAPSPLVIAPAAPKPSEPAGGPASLTLVLGPDPCLWDGRFANNAWLQECPKPFTRQVWGNAVLLALGDADRLAIADGDEVQIAVGDALATGTALRMPGQTTGVVAASWGSGRKLTGEIARNVGDRFIGLGSRAFARVLVQVSIKTTGAQRPFYSTAEFSRLQGHAEELFPSVLLAAADEPPAKESPPPSLLGTPPRGDYAWAMVIDTNACIGCSACVVACQAENNVPVVGPQEIAIGRDMHWLRIDGYGLPGKEADRYGFQPVPCMHCELAPCEPVCPVGASIHDHEGLNVQVYNRCVGTRFCEANCPYKVRRFNWFAYAGDQAYANQGEVPMKAQHNPDVSVRGRGVMEKCTYCLQRISHARRNAEKENRPIGEGEVVTACQAACPTRAIHFGDLNRPQSEVTQLRQSPRHYTLWAELNTRPRTTYLKRVYNPPRSKT